MKIAVAQVNPIIGDFEYNLERIGRFIDEARRRECDLVVFPELVVSGYPPRDLLEKADFVNASLEAADRLVDSVRGIGVILGCVDHNPAEGGNPLFNTAVLFEDGRILYKVRKRLLPTYDIFDERRYFEPGTDCSSIPYKGRRIGLTICEDIWNDKDALEKRLYPMDPLPLMVADGADLIINISASPYYGGKREFRWRMLSAIARRYGVPLVYANQVGGNDSILFDGVSTAVDEQGNIAARGKDFEEDLVVFDLEKRETDIHPATPPGAPSLLRALVMGTRDYVTKCGFKRVLVGLSGGIDSALTACIASEALGSENLLAVFMPSQYTARDNFDDTRRLAQNLGAAYRTIPIDSLYQEFMRHLPSSRPDGAPGLMEQNIQARIRGNLLMSLSNRDGYLVLSTGNKSELAVGYCTLYGDMSGGLAVISDVPKTKVYELARFVNRDREIIPAGIIARPPSAELKPDQRDEDDLPPYEILDAVLQAYVEESKSVRDIVAMGYDPELVEDIARRVDINEYKRRQAAPGLKVTTKAFGEGRRYPIAQHFRPALKD